MRKALLACVLAIVGFAPLAGCTPPAGSEQAQPTQTQAPAATTGEQAKPAAADEAKPAEQAPAATTAASQ